MKRRVVHKGLKMKWKQDIQAMTPEARKAWNEARKRTAKSGYAKRQREGGAMADRTHEGIRKRFVTPYVRPSVEFIAWLKDFQRRTAA